MHALVETGLGITDGIWGCVADGVEWKSMRHVSGREPPHVAARSARLKKERSGAIMHAEGLADLVCRLARGAEVLPDEVRSSGVAADRLDAAADRLDAAADRLDAAAAEPSADARRWADLRPGTTRTVAWPAAARGPAASPRRPVPAGAGKRGR